MCLWEPLSVVWGRPQAWPWESFLVPSSAAPGGCSSPGLAKGLQERDAVSEGGVGMADPRNPTPLGGSLVSQGALADRIRW